MGCLRNQEIPDGETLFKYCRPDIFPTGQTDIPISIFQDKELSCDWGKYQKKPEKSFHIAEGKTCIIAITVCDDIRNPKNPKRTGEIVSDWRQEIIHAPISDEEDCIHGANFSHALVKGLKKLPICEAIRDNSKILCKSDTSYNRVQPQKCYAE